MKVNMIDKTSLRKPQIMYVEGEPHIKSNVIYVSALKEATTSTNYESTKTSIKGQNTPGCTSKSTGQLLRYCSILKYFKSTKKISYQYYTYHKYTTDQVIKLRKGNCCDLSRLVNRLAVSTNFGTKNGTHISNTRYVKAKIKYKGKEYTHVWNQLQINNVWYDLDMSNYLISGSTKMFGSLIQVLDVIPGSNNPC
jgi:hypothetical protein